MKLYEIRLYNLKVIKDEKVLFEGISEDLPEELKNEESKQIVLENGEAVITL